MICYACEEDEAIQGQKLCPLCKGIQLTLRTMPLPKMVPWNGWDYSCIVIGAILAAGVVVALVAVLNS